MFIYLIKIHKFKLYKTIFRVKITHIMIKISLNES